MIVYFSGTGNSRYCAKLLAEWLDDTVLDAIPFIREGARQSWPLMRPGSLWRRSIAGSYRMYSRILSAAVVFPAAGMLIL